MKLAIMQPYFLPYIGYFQLIKAVDKFVFYDDVNYINRGWINRNRILLNKEAHYITVHQKEASQNKLINEIEIIDNRSKIKKTIINAYRRAPYFDSAWSIIEDILDYKTSKISELAAYSVTKICDYLGVKTQFEFSSKSYTQTRNLKLEKRLIAICEANKALEYINPIGGISLYKKEIFMEAGINLYFIKPNLVTYDQFENSFVENLSIVDLMMFNNSNDMALLLDEYELI